MEDIEGKPRGNIHVADLRDETTWGRLIRRIQIEPQPGQEGKYSNAGKWAADVKTWLTM